MIATAVYHNEREGKASVETATRRRRRRSWEEENGQSINVAALVVVNHIVRQTPLGFHCSASSNVNLAHSVIIRDIWVSIRYTEYR
jgi:hypothetical protein